MRILKIKYWVKQKYEGGIASWYISQLEKKTRVYQININNPAFDLNLRMALSCLYNDFPGKKILILLNIYEPKPFPIESTNLLVEVRYAKEIRKGFCEVCLWEDLFFNVD